jgi:hypothetical protein
VRSFADLARGIVDHPGKFFGGWFAGFSVLFTLAKAITQFVPGVEIKGPAWLAGATLLSAGYACWKVWKPSKVAIKLALMNTCIEVAFGDLFKQEGLRAIAVNDFFDSQLGKPVSQNSLHGAFLKHCFGGHPESFDCQVGQQLANVDSVKTAKVEGKTMRFEIGTTAMVTCNDDRYLLIAFAKSDEATCKVKAEVIDMWLALHGLWERARIEAGGAPVNLPLVGSGLSGVGLPTRDLLNLIILSAITATKIRQITTRIRIVLHKDRFDDLDLRDVQKHWEEK